MKKQPPKIAIKYSEKNWPEIKKAVDYLRGKGFSVVKRKTQLKQCGTLDDVYLMPDIKNWGWNCDFMYGAKHYDYELLTMPADFEKLKSYFEDEPKDGEIFVSTQTDHIFRYRKLGDKMHYYSKVDKDCVFTYGAKSESYHSRIEDHKRRRKATPEEEAKLIKAEHDNGYHWNGEELIEIPEYVKVIDHGETYDTHPLMEKEEGFILGYAPTNGSIWLVERIERNTNVPIAYVCFNGENRILIGSSGVCTSTKEAYEAQQKSAYEIGKWYKGNHTNEIALVLDDEFHYVSFQDGEFIEMDTNITLPSAPNQRWQPAGMTKVKELLKSVCIEKYKDAKQVICPHRDPYFTADVSDLRVRFNEFGVFVYMPVSCEPTLLSIHFNTKRGNPEIKWAEIIEEKEQHKTPSEAINSPKRLAKQVEKLERRVIELKEENKRLKAQLQTIAQQPEIIEQVKKMITE